MSAYLGYGFVKGCFTENGYVLLSDKYINNKQMLSYVCPNNHHHSISWSNWRKGARCPYCANRPPVGISFIKSEFKKEEYVLLTTKYKNAHQKLDYMCPEGHHHSITWNNWQRGERCPYCAGNVRLDISFIKQEFKKENYILLTNKYKNAKQQLKYVCPNRHKHRISWSDWKQGNRCGICKMFRGRKQQHGCWKGGISCEPYCSVWKDKEYKEDIKARDNYKCQNPDCWKTSEKLVIHHIDYDKKNCKPGNLITLCNSCNVRSNFNRERWQKLYFRMWRSKYGDC
jgi:hypothetical protein